MLKLYIAVLYWFFLLAGMLVPSLTLYAQETKIFTTRDYDLEGKVKSCLVLTSYGKEEFEFNRDGKLVKAVTRFNDRDYSITLYKYKNGHLVERRDEVYRDGTFDANTSMAHFFEADTLAGKKISEQIMNYNKQLIDRYDYFYDEEGRLSRIVRSSPEGVDETQIEYSEQNGEATTSYFLNEVLLKSIRESVKKAKDGSEQRVVLTKEYIKGIPDKALEAAYDASGKLQSEVHYEYSGAGKSFVPGKSITYEYGDRGMLKSKRTQEGKQTETKNYIFQFDSIGNWTKQITTPDNAYITRRIEYFPEPASDSNDN